MTASSQGHLNPGSDGVVFDRFTLGPELDDLVRHVWVVRWKVPSGSSRPQRVLTYPAFNAVFGPHGATLLGPSQKVSTVDLAGTSWTVGVLFRPAAAPLLTTTPPAELVGASEPIDGEIGRQISDLLTSGDYERQRISDALQRWLAPTAREVTEAGRSVNHIGRIVEDDADIVRTEQIASRAGLSRRSLERSVKSFVGVSPKWLIECRRFQEAATLLYADPDVKISDVALELGFADHAHFTRRYTEILDESPTATRQAGITARSSTTDARQP